MTRKRMQVEGKSMTQADETEMAQMIQALWERNQAQVQDRLQLLDRAAAANQHGEMGAELRSEAREIAHKLAGSLGMFGFPTGSEIARRLEMLFESDRSGSGVAGGVDGATARQPGRSGPAVLIGDGRGLDRSRAAC